MGRLQIEGLMFFTAVIMTLYLCVAGGLPPISERDLIADWRSWPLFFGTVVYCFEGISMVSNERESREDSR